MNNPYEDLDEYEHFDQERRRKQGKVDGEPADRRIERVVGEKKQLTRELVKARQQARRGMGRRRPPNRDE